MLAPDRSHLAATHASAVQQDEKLRLWVRELDEAQADTGSVADLVRRLREHGDYWERVQKGRLQAVKRGIARLMQPFFKPQVRYNLMVAEHLGRIEVALGEIRGELRDLRASMPPRSR
jgi:hypothetical protein